MKHKNIHIFKTEKKEVKAKQQLLNHPINIQAAISITVS